MTIAELIQQLEEAQEVYGEEAEVRLMMQPNWPFEYSIHGTTSNLVMHGYDDDDEGKEEPGEPIVFICEGTQLGYGSKAAWDSCC